VEVVEEGDTGMVVVEVDGAEVDGIEVLGSAVIKEIHGCRNEIFTAKLVLEPHGTLIQVLRYTPFGFPHR